MLYLGLALLLSVQSINGSISGFIKDRAGEPISEAAITISDSANGITRTVVSGRTGLFIAPQLPPGVYSIIVEKLGFGRIITNGLVLTAASHLTVGSLELESSAQESVTLPAGRLEIQAASGERSGLLTSKQIRDLSLNGRNMLELLSIIPGVVSFVDGQISAPGGLAAININGTRGNQRELTIDGSSNLSPANNNSVYVTINPDAVAEVKILTANYQAEYARAGGGIIQFVTPSGSRDYHGGARFFHRHEGLNANNYFRNAEGRADGSEIQPRSLYRYNYMGYDIGGPAPLERWNQNRDKVFFYWNQEFYRQLVPGTARNIRVPTTAERRGDFSATVDGNGNRIFIRDPNRSGNCNATDQTACFPGNVVPPERFFQDGPAILNIYPLPNFSGENRFNYTSSLSNTFPRREDIVRVDYNISSQTRLMLRYINNTDSQRQPYGPGNFLLSPGVSRGIGRNGAVSLSQSLSPTLAHEFLFAPGTRRMTRTLEGDRAARQAHGINFPLLFRGSSVNDYISNFTYGAIANISAFPTANFTAFPFRLNNDVFNFSDNLTKVWGSHIVKTGIFIQRSRTDRTSNTPVGATINFSSAANNPLNTGHPFANALLGIYSQYQQSNNSPLGSYRFTNVEGYIQDSWKVTPRLTLDYGLRISWNQPEYDTQLQTAVFNPDLYDRSKSVRLYQPICLANAACTAAPNLRAVDPANRPAIPTVANTLPDNFVGLIVPDSGDMTNGIGRASQGYIRGGFENGRPQLGPHFGFAHDFFGNGKTVVRGGFGIGYDRVEGEFPSLTLLNPPTVSTPTMSFGRLQDLATAAVYVAPAQVTGVPRNSHIPAVYSYSFGVQRELVFNTVIDAAYVATLSRHLPQVRNLNAIPYGTTFTREAQDPTRYAGGIVPETEPNLPEVYRQAGLRFSGANAKRIEFLTPFPGYGNILYREFVGSANYHSLQIAANRRLSQGLHFGLSYTWSKTLVTANADAEVTHAFETRRYDYRLAGFDRRHVFGGGFVYNAPRLSAHFGGHWLSRAFFDDWQISGISSFVSGAPLELNVSIGGVNAGQRITGSYSEPPRFFLNGAPQPGSNGMQIDPAALVIPRVGDAGPWPRQYLRGPGVNNQNIALFKNFPIAAENGRRLQLRFEMFNAFNHTQFTSINLATNLTVPNAAGGFATGAAIFNDYSRALITSNLRPSGSTEPLGRFFGEYNGAATARIIQLGIKLYY